MGVVKVIGDKRERIEGLCVNAQYGFKGESGCVNQPFVVREECEKEACVLGVRPERTCERFRLRIEFPVRITGRM